MNDPISHSPFWPIILAKLSLNIPKFDGKSGDYPNNHVMTFHLWCSSNSLMDDSIRLCIFQRNLTRTAAKWYIELPGGLFRDFNSLAMAFLTHFQILIRYQRNTKLLTSLQQTASTHISNHIHEWIRRIRIIKAHIPDKLLAKWFTKYLLGPITRDVSMGGVVIEEQAISHDRCLDLVYSQTDTLYNMIPHAPRSSTNPNPTRLVGSHVVNGVINCINQENKSKTSTTTSNPKTTPTTTTTPNTTPPSTPINTSEVNTIQSTPTAKSQQTGNKKKGKGKIKQNAQPQEKLKTPPSEDKEKRKHKYPCLICNEYHYTKYCLHRVDVNCFLKGTSTAHVVLTNHFPSQTTQMVTQEQPSGPGISCVLMCTTNKDKEVYSQREPKIILPRMEVSLRSLLCLPHYILVLYILIDQVQKQWLDHLQKVLIVVHLLICMHELLRTTVL
jgi:hypothetical protein